MRILINPIATAAAVLASSLALFSPTVTAMTAYPNLVTETQSDGTTIDIRINGDEYDHYVTTNDGYTIMKKTDGVYYYANLDSNTGELKPTNKRADKKKPPNGIGKKLRPSQAAFDKKCKEKKLICDKSLAPPNNNNKDKNKNKKKPWARRLRGMDEDTTTDTTDRKLTTTIGTLPNLVIPIRFNDHVGRTLPSKSDINILMNNQGPSPEIAPTGSVRDVFVQSSYNQLDMVSTITEWVTVPGTQAYYTNGQSGLSSKTWELITDALNLVDPSVNFNDFDIDEDNWIDAIAFFHSGYAAEFGGTDEYGASDDDRMWSHKWQIPTWTSSEGVYVSKYHISPAVWGTSGTAIGRIGVVAHETGHFLDRPDLYDIDSGGGSGIGSWGLMANSWGFDGSQYYPPLMSADSRLVLGWDTPTEITQDGIYQVYAAGATTSTGVQIYKISYGMPANEYLLIENRQSIGFDNIPGGGGIVIYHIDDNTGYDTEGYPGQSGWPANGNHYRVAILQADGNYNLEKGNNRGDSGDLWNQGDKLLPSTGDVNTGPFPNTDSYQGGIVTRTGISITDISASGTTMSFRATGFGVTQPPTPSPPPTSSPTLSPTVPPTPCVGMAVQVNLLTDNYPQETEWTITNDCEGGALVQSSPAYPAQATSYTNQYCLSNAKYTFTINDSAEDGICCGYGNGSVDVKVDGTTAMTAGDFGNSTSTSFGSCVSNPDTPSPTESPSKSPSKAPTLKPTAVPTLSPTPGPSSSPVVTPDDEVLTCQSEVIDSTIGKESQQLGSCGTTDGSGGGVWYKLYGTGVATTLTTCAAETNYDTKIRVFTASDGTCVGGNDDDCGLQSSVTFDSVEGVEYDVLVHGYNTAEGTFKLSVDCATTNPTLSPVTANPTEVLTESPSKVPTKVPSLSPSTSPSKSPSKVPTELPSSSPTDPDVPPPEPTDPPVSNSPSTSPSKGPSVLPSKAPTDIPTLSPSKQPSSSPTVGPSASPTKEPTSSPSLSPSSSPSKSPSVSPSSSPSSSPVIETESPSKNPTTSPSLSPSQSPSKGPSVSPSVSPTKAPTNSPSSSPSKSPSKAPTLKPTSVPTLSPTPGPSLSPVVTPDDEVLTCQSEVSASTIGKESQQLGTCGGTTDGTGGGVWYKFYGTGVTTTLTTCAAETNYDTKIRVFTASGICVGGNDDNCGLQSSVTFDSVEGVEYDVLVHGYSSAEGTFKLSVDCATPNPTLSPVTANPTLSPVSNPTIQPTKSPTPNPTESPVLPPPPGASDEFAVYDPAYGAPNCEVVGKSCSSGNLLVGRFGLSGGSEPNSSNTLDDSEDGSSGTYQSDESLDMITVSSLNGGPLMAGELFNIKVDVWAWSNGDSDSADFYYTNDATATPIVWTLLNTLGAGGPDRRTLTLPADLYSPSDPNYGYTLSNGPNQAVRVRFRYSGSRCPLSTLGEWNCNNGSYDDIDDLMFTVAPAAPASTASSPWDNSKSDTSSFKAAAAVNVPDDTQVKVTCQGLERERCNATDDKCYWKNMRKGCLPK